MKTTIKGEKYRGEATIDGKKFNTIMDKTYLYSWMNGAAEGTKFNLKEMEQLGKDKIQPGAQKESVVDVEQEYDMDCKPTTSSDSLFVPPSNVLFQDMSEMMKQMQDQLANLPNMPNVEYDYN